MLIAGAALRQRVALGFSHSAAGAFALRTPRMASIGAFPRRNLSIGDIDVGKTLEDFMSNTFGIGGGGSNSNVAMTEFVSHGVADGYLPVSWIQMGLEHFHSATGTPWWLSIFALGASVRLICFPLQAIERYKKEQMDPFKEEYARENRRLSKLRNDGKRQEAMQGYQALKALKASRGHWSETKFVGLMMAQASLMVSLRVI